MRTNASRIGALGAACGAQPAPPLVESQSVWSAAARKKTLAVPLNQGEAKEWVTGTPGVPMFCDCVQTPFWSRNHSPESPAATPEVRLITNTERMRVFTPGTGDQVAPSSLLTAIPQSVPT